MVKRAATAPAEQVPTASSSSSIPLAGLDEELSCTICSGHFEDPVVTPGGITYCKGCILQWLKTGDTCPVTRKRLSAHQLVPNYVVKRLIERLQLQQNPAAASGAKQRAAAAAPSKPRARVARTLAPVPPPVEPAISWQAALAAAQANPADAAAWQLLGRFLAGNQAVCLQAAFVGPSADTCITAFAQYTAPYLANLRSLDLSHNHITAAGLMALVQYAAWHWPNLVSLNLSCCQLTAAGVAALAQHAPRHWLQLTDLDLSANDMGDAGLAALAQYAAFYRPKLEYLNLKNNNVTAAGIAALGQQAAPHWVQLLELNLGGNALGDTGVKALILHAGQCWTKLQSLDLSSNKLGDAGVTALAAHATLFQHLESLNVSNNQLTDAGVAALAQQAAQYWPHLRALDLSQNSVNVDGVDALAQYAAPLWPQLGYLDLDSNPLLLDSRRLMQMPSAAAADALAEFVEQLGHSCWLRPQLPLQLDQHPPTLRQW